ncbi:unnamed protein product [Calypogeia fissa]
MALYIGNYIILPITRTSASISESSQGRLRLLQHDFRTRVTSIGSRVDLHFNDGRRPACFQARTRTGKSVELSPLSNESTGKENRSSALKRTPVAAAFPIIDINSISRVILDNGKSRSPQFEHLREVFYDLLCHPDRCPSLLSLALKCGTGNALQNQQGLTSISIPKEPKHAAIHECTMASTSKQPQSERPKTLKKPEPGEVQKLCKSMGSISKESQSAKAKIMKEPEDGVPKLCTKASISKETQSGKAKIVKEPKDGVPKLCRMSSISNETQSGKAKIMKQRVKEQEDDVPKLCTKASPSKEPLQAGTAKITKKATGEVPKCKTAGSTSKNPNHGRAKLPKKQKPGAVAAAPQFTKTSTVSRKSSHFNAKAKIQTKQEDAAFPKEAPKLESEYFDEVFSPLNFSQREALLQILTSPLSATIGPPGTGKTRLITAVAKAWLHARGDQEVLLCTAYQNVAARNIAEALTEEQVPGVLLLVSEDYFVEWHETFYEKLAMSTVITKAKSELPGALEDWRTRNKRGTVPILVCTLGLVGSRAFTRNLMGGKVTAMIIDECSQAAEGDCIYPLTCLPDLSLLTVLGDPHQLPPFSGSGFGSKSIKVPSIFDLISNACEVKMLKEQYRMPPKICSFISAEIYNNELRTSPNRRDEKDWHQPLLWIDIQGVSTKDPGKTSMYNMAEAQAIVQVCRKLRTKCYMGRGVVVLTMYEEQNRRICKLLEMEANDLRENVKVHNVDSFQGQQSDIVLISLVAGPYFSPFVADRHRACVMLSRVRRFLCVCGNHDAIRRNSQALLWQTLATFCGACGLVASLKGAESMFDANLLAAPFC